MSVSEQTKEQEHMPETKSFVRTNDIPPLKRATRTFNVVAVQQQRQKGNYVYIYIYIYIYICDWIYENMASVSV